MPVRPIANPGVAGYNAILRSHRHKENLMKSKNIIRPALVTALILLLPLAAMQFNAGVDWSLFDFIVAGALIFVTGLAFELVLNKAQAVAYRAAAGVALAASFLLIWINLAVGIIGSEDNPANMMYFAVILIAVAGAAIARLRAPGMARAMFVTASALALVPLIALVTGGFRLGAAEPPPGAPGVLLLNACFVMLFVVSALLFRRSAQHLPAGTASVEQGSAGERRGRT